MPIWVNRAGKRFGDESFYRDYLPKVRAWDGVAQAQPNFPPYLVFDGNYRDKYPLGTFLPGQDLPEELVARAGTLREARRQAGDRRRGARGHGRPVQPLRGRGR